MEWIKTRYDRFLLLLAAIILIGISGWLIFRAVTFASKFNLAAESGTAKIPQPDIDAVNASQDKLSNPEKWDTTATIGQVPAEQARGILFASRVFIDRDGVLIDPTLPDSPPIHPPLSNQWILDNNLPLKDPNILTLDSDGDGFDNLMEWNYKTEPDDDKSHPEFPTKLVLERIIPHPFNLEFRAVTSPGPPPTFQIDATNSSEPTQFLTIGDEIKGSTFKITSFKENFVDKPNGTKDELHELTITSTENGEVVVLVLRKRTNVGKDEAVLKFLLTNEQIVRAVEQTFSLKPEPNVVYEVMSVSETEVKITRKSDGKEYLIKKP